MLLDKFSFLQFSSIVISYKKGDSVPSEIFLGSQEAVLSRILTRCGINNNLISGVIMTETVELEKLTLKRKQLIIETFNQNNIGKENIILFLPIIFQVNQRKVWDNELLGTVDWKNFLPESSLVLIENNFALQTLNPKLTDQEDSNLIHFPKQKQTVQ